MPAPPTVESRLGRIIEGRYRLDAVLGTGGFGAVYRARHLELDHDVAIKLLHEGVDASTAKRLTREAKVLARLDHPNCARVMDFGTEGGTTYLVMELIDGRPLGTMLGEPWPPRRAVDTALELLAGLGHAHQLGLVHRDLKPANVLLAERPGGGSTVRIIDFGIVTIAAGEQLASFTEQLTATGAIIGTPRYMSPEQLLGAKVDARSDLYALGLILYEMLTGHAAFEAGDVRYLAYMHAVAPTPLLPDGVPDELAALVGRLLAKKPEQRPTTTADVRQHLLALRPSLPDAPPGVTAGPATTANSEPRAAEELSVGPRARVGRYSLLRELGHGATGTVYLGWDETLDRQVAVKLLRPSPAHLRAGERMLREARGLARVAHENVVAVYEFGSHQGQLFVAMEHVRGRTLRAWRDEGSRPWTDTLARLLEAGRGLAAVHAAGLVHRDFKPDNVLVGDDERARVVDFGLVRAASPAFEMVDKLAPELGDTKDEASTSTPRHVDPLKAKLTRTGAIIGTPAYMALEQLAGQHVDARSDQFAFCVVAYEALYGQRPFVGRSLEDLAAKLAAGHLQPRPDGSLVPRRVDEVLARGLQVVPGSRWDGMSSLLDALERAAGVGRGWSTRRSLAGGGAGLLLLVGAAWALASADETTAPEPTRGVATTVPTHDQPPLPTPALERTQALLARARPDHAESWRDAIELGARHRDAMTPEIRASLHAVAGAMHESQSLRDLGPAVVQAWSPAAPVLALGRRDGGIALWDVDARAPMRALEHAGPLVSPSFSRDGALLVAREGEQRAVLWHVSTGTKLGAIEQAGLRQAVFVADTQQLMIASDEGVSRWGLVRGRELERTAVASEDPTVVGLASVDEQVMLLSSRGRVSRWTTESEPLVHVDLQGFEERAEQILVLAPDATRVVRTSALGLELWDALSGTSIATRISEPATIVGVEFSDDSRTLAVMLRGRAPLLLDTSTAAPRVTMPSRAEVLALAFDPAEDRLLALRDDGVIERVVLGSGHVSDHFVGPAPGARMLAIDSTGSWLSVIGEDGTAAVWATGSVASSDDGESAAFFASLAEGRGPTIDAQGHVRGSSGESIAILAPEGPVTAVALSPDASTIATASGAWPTRVELWTRQGQRTHTLEVDGELRVLAFSADGARLACAGAGPRVEICSVADATAVIELRTTETEIGTLAFSPDGTRLAVGGHEVHLWQLDTGFDLAMLAPARAPVAALGFAPDGRQLGIAYEDGTRVIRWVDEQVLLAELCRVGAAVVDAGACEGVLGQTQE
ncbi:WD40 repeat domain-containing serine/threonine protein kinase [Paraliomyxa miuraensis]|uniref:WD40 repeat domain-containing serine/threonine protein kinase n=1 Tax=Paraliomyxa miuraensis TaxID=376150 RepID=UPI00224F59FD|nr:WD40 repeat domain-containing serine/threonine-protein kinase [Paraliomyxa miuraensis]MCX4242706.1 serine/threonine-protein kinase [Paraliomyxa miuraensis]